MPGDNGPRLEMWAIDRIKPYDKNPRTLPEKAVQKVMGSLKQFGFQKPIVVDEAGVVIAGHVVLKAAQQAGFSRVPVLISNLDAKAAKAYRLADNRTAQETDWLEDLLKDELTALDEDGFDLASIGFDDRELQKLLSDDEEAARAEETPEPPVNPVSVLGDVWIMGNHRIVCGDCTDVASWDNLDIGDGFVCFSSPPYNAGDASGLRDTYVPGKPKSRKFYDVYSDNQSSDGYVDLLTNAMQSAFAYCDTVAFNLQPLANSKRPLLQWMSDHSSHLVDVITWDKGNAAPHIQPGIMASRFEWIVIMARAENASRVIPHSSWQGKYSNVYHAPPQRDNQFANQHGATFPVHLPEFMMGDLMNRARGVVDCFNGTGTTIIAAERLGRAARGIELSPAYVDVAVKRWQDFTGQKAIHEATGKTFEQLNDERYDQTDDCKRSYDAGVKAMRENLNNAA